MQSPSVVHAVAGGLGGEDGVGGAVGGESELWVTSCDGLALGAGGVFDPEVPHATSETTATQSHPPADLTMRVRGALDAFISARETASVGFRHGTTAQPLRCAADRRDRSRRQGGVGGLVQLAKMLEAFLDGVQLLESFTAELGEDTAQHSQREGARLAGPRVLRHVVTERENG